MTQPEALKRDRPLKWSAGTGTDVWTLFCACLAGELDTVKRLLASDPSLARCHHHYRKPLYFAVRENRLEVAALLLEFDPDPFGLAVNDSLLEITRDRGYPEMERLLETKFAERFGASSRGEPVAAAIREHDLARLRALLDASPGLLHTGDQRSNQPIHWAVMTRQIELVEELLKHGAHPNVEIESSADTLSAALATAGYSYLRMNPDMVELLCSHGASRAVHLLAYSGDIVTAAAVLAANPALANDPDALANAASEGKEAFVRLMLRYQPDLPRRVGFPAWAVGAKTRALNELLFQHGMNPSAPDWLGITPLHHCARGGDVEKAALFLDHGADLHARDEDLCSTPLGWAAKCGQRPMVEFLLRRGAKPDLPDDPPWATPLAWAKRRGHPQVAELLRHHGARAVG